MTFVATYSGQAAWDTQASNAFVFGSSTLDGGDVLAGQFYTDFGGAEDTITADIKEVLIVRGRDDYLSSMNAGTMSLVLKDPEGKYNPKNSASVLYGKLLPMRPIRLRATYNGTTYGLFRGFIRSINWDAENYETNIEAEDLFMWMDRVDPIIASTGVTTTGNAIRAILDYVGFSEAALRNIGVGDSISDFSADGSESALSIVGQLLAAERGAFFVDRDGVATYLDRSTIQKIRTVSHTITEVVGSTPGVDLDLIRNRARVTKTGGTQQEATDGDSQASFGWGDIPAVTTPYLPSDAAALRLARWLVAQRKSLVPPVRDVSLVNRTQAEFTTILGTELLQRITLSDPTTVSTSQDYMIQGIRHSISEGGTLHRCSLSLEERSTDYFQFGVSTLDGDDVMGY